jgi:hypothetical protein
MTFPKRGVHASQEGFFLKRLEAHLYPKLAKEAAVPTAPRMSLARVQFIADSIFLLGFFCKYSTGYCG